MFMMTEGIEHPSEMLPCQQEETNYDRNLKYAITQYPRLVNMCNYIYDLDDISRQSLHNYLRTGKIEKDAIHGDNVRNYLEIAIAMGKHELVGICEEILLENLYPINSLDMFNIGTAYSMKQLRAESMRLVELHIYDICESDSIGRIGPNDLIDLLHNSMIKQTPHAMQAVTNWWRYEPDPRQKHFDAMMKYLQEFNQRFPTLTNDPNNNNNASHYNYQIMFHMRHSVLNVFVCEPCRNRQKNIVLAGCKDVGTNLVACCLQNDDSEDPHVYLSCDSSPKRVYHFDIVLNRQKKCSKRLNFGRTMHCMEATEGRVYVLGGTMDGYTLSEIEEFNPKRHSWKVIGHLLHPVHSAGSVVYNSDIYVFGGVLYNGEITSVIQKFSPETGTTTIMSHLPYSAISPRVVIFKESIYIAFTGVLVCYEPRFSVTRLCANIPGPCVDFAMFTEKETIYIMGDLGRQNTDNSYIYMYLPAQDLWKQSVHDPPCNFAVKSSCAVKIPSTFDLVPFLGN